MKPFKKMCVPQLRKRSGRPADDRWVVKAVEKELNAYLHDDIEWYDGGCIARSQSIAGVTEYDTTGEFYTEKDAWVTFMAYYIKHEKVSKNDATVDNVESQVMEF